MDSTTADLLADLETEAMRLRLNDVCKAVRQAEAIVDETGAQRKRRRRLEAKADELFATIGNRQLERARRGG